MCVYYLQFTWHNDVYMFTRFCPAAAAKMIRSLFVVGFGVSTLLMVSSKLLCDSYNDKTCMEPQAMKNGYFVNQWSVHMPNVPKDEAKQELQNAGFIYLGQVYTSVSDTYLDMWEGERKLRRPGRIPEK